MKKILHAGLMAGIVLLILSVCGLYATIWFFPALAAEYYNPAFDKGEGKVIFYYVHPFVISMALSWFWSRFKIILTGSFITRGIEFAIIYVMVATIPMLLLVYSAMDVSLQMIASWLALALCQGITAGLVCEKINP